MLMIAMSRFRGSGKPASIHGTRCQRMASLSARWAERRVTQRLLLANRTLTRCNTILHDETRSWARGDASVLSLFDRLEQQLSATVQFITGARLHIALERPDGAQGQRPRRPSPVTVELARTERLVGLVESAAEHAWMPVEKQLPASCFIDYRLGGRILALAGVNVEAERQRLHTAVAARRYGERLNLATNIRNAFSRELMDALDTWSAQTASGVVSPAPATLRLA